MNQRDEEMPTYRSANTLLAEIVVREFGRAKADWTLRLVLAANYAVSLAVFLVIIAKL